MANAKTLGRVAGHHPSKIVGAGPKALCTSFSIQMLSIQRDMAIRFRSSPWRHAKCARLPATNPANLKLADIGHAQENIGRYVSKHPRSWIQGTSALRQSLWIVALTGWTASRRQYSGGSQPSCVFARQQDARIAARVARAPRCTFLHSTGVATVRDLGDRTASFLHSTSVATVRFRRTQNR